MHVFVLFEEYSGEFLPEVDVFEVSVQHRTAYVVFLFLANPTSLEQLMDLGIIIR